MTLPDRASIDTYGGPMANYSDVVDGSTDEDAKYRNMYAADVAMMGRVALRAMASFVGANGAAPTDPGGFIHDAMWGATVALKPLAARTGEGVWTLTYPGTGHGEETVPDELTPYVAAVGGEVTHTLNFRRAYAQVECTGGVLKHAVAEVTSANVITVRGFLADGTADDLAGLTITVWIY